MGDQLVDRETGIGKFRPRSESVYITEYCNFLSFGAV
jgi:hypothetical protein